jgi:hypothetical protein
MDKSRTSKGSGLSLDLLLVTLLLVIGLGIRWLYVLAVVFPPLDDPAFYLTTAENLVSGRGLEVDVLWSYQIKFPAVSHPSHEHWMPLTTGLMAGAFALHRVVSQATAFSLRTGQLPGLILGSLLVLLTYVLGRRLLPAGRANRWLAFCAALLVALNGTLSYQSASADSSAPYALLACWALAFAVRRPGDQGGYLGAGLLIGLAYLTRADGLLLLLAIPLAWWLLPPPPRPQTELPDNPTARLAWERWPREQSTEENGPRVEGPSVANLLDLGVAFALVVSGWLVRNYVVFGTLLPSSILNQVWLTDYIDTFSYASQPTLATWMAQGLPAILAQRGQALLSNGIVFLLLTFAWGLLALPGMWLLRYERTVFTAVIYGMILFFATALIFPVSSMSGTFYHSLGAVIPFLAVAAVYAIYRGVWKLVRKPKLRRVAFIAVIAGLLVLAATQLAASLSSVSERHEVEETRFEAAAEWLTHHAEPGDVIMTTQTYTLNYTSGYPCIALPGNESLDAAWEAAQRYRARFLVITQTVGQYPGILHDQPDPRFHFLASVEGNEIYEIVLDAGTPAN